MIYGYFMLLPFKKRGFSLIFHEITIQPPLNHGFLHGAWTMFFTENPRWPVTAKAVAPDHKVHK
jgi:hypothetical protein